MIQKKITRQNLIQHSSAQENLAYWLSRPTEERLAAVESLRRQYYGSSARLQKVINKRALGRKRDLADLEALGGE